MRGAVGGVPVTAAHDAPVPDALAVTALGVVEVGQAEGVSELVAEYADVDHAATRSGAVGRGLDDVVADTDEAAAVRGIVGRVGLSSGDRPLLVDPAVRPDVGAAAALAAGFIVHEGGEVDEAVVVARVRDAVGTVVVINRKVDGAVVGVEEFLDELAGARVARREPPGGALIIGVDLRHLHPVVHRAGHVDVAVRHLVVVLGNGAGHVVEEFVLERRRRIGRRLRLVVAQEHGNTNRAAHHELGRKRRAGGLWAVDADALAEPFVARLLDPARLLNPRPLHLVGAAVLFEPIEIDLRQRAAVLGRRGGTYLGTGRKREYHGQNNRAIHYPQSFCIRGRCRTPG